jgi:hypothetical protein
MEIQMEENYRQTEMSFSMLIHNLYGDKEYRLIHTSHDFNDAKNYFLKMIKSIRFAIEETITITDETHKRELLDRLSESEKLIKSSNSFDSLDQRMIAIQSELIFVLIGAMPHQSQKEKVINNRNSWKLDDYRQIQYTQNISQKEHLLRNAIQGKYKDRFGSWNEFLDNIYYKQCHYNPTELIAWIKTNHPDIYCD